MQTFLSLLIISAFISLSLTWGVRNFAVRRGIISPLDSHHIHDRLVPRIGGIAIFTTFSGFVLLYVLVFRMRLTHSAFGMDIAKIALPGSLLFGVGLLDDLRGLRARIKLLFQIVGGACLFCSGLSFPALDLNVAGLPVGAMLSFSLTIFWVVLLCNGLNFIDGLDGLAAGTGFLACIPLFIFALITGRPVLSMAIVMFSGALLGFLVFNFNPASIFLGDSGSLFIGFILSGLLLSELRNGTNSLRLIPSLLVAFTLPVTDTALSVLRRLLIRRSLFSPDREHIHHRLISIGFPHRQAVLILYGVSTIAAGLSVVIASAPPLVVAGASALCSLLTVVGLSKLRYREYSDIFRLLHISLQTKGSSTIYQQPEGLAKSAYGPGSKPYFLSTVTFNKYSAGKPPVGLGLSRQYEGSELAVRAEKQNSDAIHTSDVALQNLTRVATSAAEIKAVLVEDAGLVVDLKDWVARDVTDHGQIVGDSDLTNDAILDRLEMDNPVRSIATSLVQQYGFLLPNGFLFPKLNPDSDLGKQHDLLIEERTKWLAQNQEEELTQARQRTIPSPENVGLCDPQLDLDKDCAASQTRSSNSTGIRQGPQQQEPPSRTAPLEPNTPNLPR